MNITGKFLKAWKIEDKGNYKKVNIGDSRKNKDGSYDNFTWFGAMFVGKAKDIELNEKDTFEVKSGIIYQNKYNNKWYTNLVIFDIGVTKKAEVEYTDLDDDLSDIPF